MESAIIIIKIAINYKIHLTIMQTTLFRHNKINSKWIIGGRLLCNRIIYKTKIILIMSSIKISNRTKCQYRVIPQQTLIHGMSK